LPELALPGRRIPVGKPAGIPPSPRLDRGEDDGMLELRLRSGQVVSFDGRIVEVFAQGRPSERFHVAQLAVPTPTPVEADAGACTLGFEEGAARLFFAREEAPACSRLVTAIAEAVAAIQRPRDA
jgi:hypothetical protein